MDRATEGRGEELCSGMDLDRGHAVVVEGLQVPKLRLVVAQATVEPVRKRGVRAGDVTGMRCGRYRGPQDDGMAGERTREQVCQEPAVARNAGFHRVWAPRVLWVSG